MSLPTEFVAEPDAVMLDVMAESGESAIRVRHARRLASPGASGDAPRFQLNGLERVRLAADGTESRALVSGSVDTGR